MPEIRDYFSPRQKVNIETRKELLLNELRDNILADFEYIGDTLYSEFGKSYFTIDEFASRLGISKQAAYKKLVEIYRRFVNGKTDENILVKML